MLALSPQTGEEWMRFCLSRLTASERVKIEKEIHTPPQPYADEGCEIRQGSSTPMEMSELLKELQMED